MPRRNIVGPSPPNRSFSPPFYAVLVGHFLISSSWRPSKFLLSTIPQQNPKFLPSQAPHCAVADPRARLLDQLLRPFLCSLQPHGCGSWHQDTQWHEKKVVEVGGCQGGLLPSEDVGPEPIWVLTSHSARFWCGKSLRSELLSVG